MNRIIGIGAAFGASLLLLATLRGAGVQSSKIVLDHADTLRSKGGIRELIGHVKVTRGGTTIRAENALYTPDLGQISLTGSVYLTDPERTMRAERVEYDERTGNFDAQGGIDMTVRDSVRIRCRSAHFTDFNRTAELFDDVIIDIFRDTSRITGDYGQFRTTDSSGWVEGSSKYVRPERGESSNDTLLITSDRLAFSRKDNSATFTGDVKLTRGEILAVSDSLFYMPDSNNTRLSGAPLIWRGSDELTGDLIDLKYKDRELKVIDVFGNGIALSPAYEGDKRRNRLAGKKLTLEILNDSSRVVLATGDAQGWYFVFDSKKGYQGVNVAGADLIRLDIYGKKTTNILLEGQTSGAFYPPGQEPPQVNDIDAKKMDGIGWGEL